MTTVKFVDHKFNAASQALLEHTTEIMTEYARLGYRLTLRQLYYQMIARDLFPEAWIDPATHTKNNMRNYKKFGDLVNNGRLAGRLDWDMIEDRARETQTPAAWDSPAQIVRACAYQFKFDKWETQPAHIEIMVEKDAVSGIVAPVCARLDVRFTANRGYASSSLYYEMSRRLVRAARLGKKVHILYLGDHDPSGQDMTRDLIERMETFTFGQEIAVTRGALNMDQVRMWGPPENPAKETDSRFEAYFKEYGDKSWELDAIEPRELAGLVERYVLGLREPDAWGRAVKREEEARGRLEKIAAEMTAEDNAAAADQEEQE